MQQVAGRPWLLTITAVLATAMAGCDDTSTTPAPGPSVLSAVPHEVGPIFYELEAELDQAALIEVVYWAEDVAPLRVVSDQPRVTHRLVLPRLRPQRTYSFELVARGADGQSADTSSGSFQTEAIPAALDSTRFTSSGDRSFPLLYLSVAGSFNGGVVLDEANRVVWYYETERPIHAMAHRANGNIVLNTREGLMEIDPLGQLVSLLPAREVHAHHEVIATPRNTLMFIAFEPKEVDGREIVGEAIWEWSPETGLKEKRWSSFDHLSWEADQGPRSVEDDWLHANSLSIGPRGNVLISFHFLDQVASIAPDFSGFEWRLGGEASDFVLPPAAEFSGQHTAAELATDRVLLFDNGFARSNGEQYSRAIELQLDRSAGTADVAWEYAPEPPIWARIISSVRRLDNGNSVVTFGTSAGLVNSSGPIAVHEVSAAGEPVWALEVGEPVRFTFRGEPMQAIASEAPVP